MRRSFIFVVIAGVAAAAVGAWMWARRGAETLDAPPRTTVDEHPAAAPTDLAAAPVRSPTSPKSEATAHDSAPAGASKTSLWVAVNTPEVQANPLARVIVIDSSRKTTTAALDVEGKAHFAELATGVARIWAECPGFVINDPHEVNLVAGSDNGDNLMLARGASVVGRVVAAGSGLPIPGATIDARDGGTVGTTSRWGRRESYGSVTSDAHGMFATTPLPFAEIVTVTVRARGFQAQGVAMRLDSIDAARTPLEFRLDPGGIVRGVVTTPTGEPATEAEVFARPASWAGQRADPREWSSDEWGRERSSPRSKPGADGRFEIDGLPFDVPICVTALDPKFARSTDRCDVVLSNRSPIAILNIGLRRASTLELTLLGPDDHPLTWALIRVAGMDKGATPDRAGVVRLEKLDPGETSLEVQEVGFVSFRDSIVLDEGGTLVRTIRLSRGLTISGVVIASDGSPVEGASIHASRIGVGSSGFSARSAHDGTFRLNGLEDAAHDVVASKDGFEQSTTLSIATPAVGVKLTLARLVVVRARLVVPTQPAPEEVSVGERRDGYEHYAYPIPWNGGLVQWSVVPGSWQLFAYVPGLAPLMREVTVVGPAAVDLGDLVFEEGVTLLGKVVDPAGMPVQDALVRFESAKARSARTDAGGGFRFEHMPRFPVRLVAHADGFRDETRTIDGSKSPSSERFVLRRGALVTFALKLGAGEKRPVGLVALGYVEGDSSGAEEYSRGDSLSLRLPAGKVRIDLEAGGKVLWTRSVTLEEGKDVELEAALAAK